MNPAVLRIPSFHIVKPRSGIDGHRCEHFDAENPEEETRTLPNQRPPRTPASERRRDVLCNLVEGEGVLLHWINLLSRNSPKAGDECTDVLNCGRSSRGNWRFAQYRKQTLQMFDVIDDTFRGHDAIFIEEYGIWRKVDI
jgi:hypothetical protein